MEVGREASEERKPETIHEGGGRGMQEAMEVWREPPEERKPETIQEGGGKWLQLAIEVGEGGQRRGSPRQYRRAEVEAML